MCLGAQNQRQIVPNNKLNSMLCLLKVLLALNLVCAVMRSIYSDYSGMLSDLLTSCFLMCALYNMYFVSMAMYLMFCLFNEVMIIFEFGQTFQRVIQKKLLIKQFLYVLASCSL